MEEIDECERVLEVERVEPTEWEKEPLEAFYVTHQTTKDIEPLRIPLDKALPRNFKEASRHPRKEKWRIAMEKELKALKDNNT